MPRQADPTAQAAKPQGVKKEKKPFEYTPSQWVVNRIKEFPFKDDLKRIYGVDLEALLNNPKDYGVLEGIASSNFTLVPIELKINEKEAFIKECIDKSRGKADFNEAEQRAALQKWVPDTGYTSGFYTVRLWYVPGTEKWGVDKHEARLGKKVGEDGQVVMKDNGEEKQTWDVNPLHESSIIKFDGKPLTKDQMDHLRLTGTIGAPIDHQAYNGSEQKVLLFKDPYNEHEVVTITLPYNKAQLDSRIGSKTDIYVEGMGNGVYRIDKNDGSLAIAASGGYIWVTNVKDPSEKINVWFDPRTRKFRPTIASDPKMDYSMARAKEISDKSRKQAQEAASVSQSKGKGNAMGK